ncbi:hypothetical protein ACRALDRAFT_2030583 [Sodiomyces alcalophilus JCM 7366]|uniref:uncharacterized protein n=1 Tax=Sodiomyces alcalophilus JCM 7366 TaxID=591952 RepID=UPI0039B578F1
MPYGQTGSTLSPQALAALAEFNAEKDGIERRFAELKAKVDEAMAKGSSHDSDMPVTMDHFMEDWNKSQFWYSDETAKLLAGELLKGATETDTIAILSAPSVLVAMKNLMSEYEPGRPKPKVVLLEYDQRFAVFPEFVAYDYRHPFKLPASLKGSVDRILCDPPFLEEDCQTKSAMTARWMAKSPGSTDGKVIVCTGERMKDLVAKVYKSFGVRSTTFEPAHANNLNNEFWCYANFSSEHWDWRN